MYTIHLRVFCVSFSVPGSWTRSHSGRDGLYEANKAVGGLYTAITSVRPPFVNYRHISTVSSSSSSFSSHFRVEAAVVLRSAGLTQFLPCRFLFLASDRLCHLNSRIFAPARCSSQQSGDRPPGGLCRIDTPRTIMTAVICVALLGFATDGRELFRKRMSSLVVLFLARLGLKHSENYQSFSPSTASPPYQPIAIGHAPFLLCYSVVFLIFKCQRLEGISNKLTFTIFITLISDAMY